MAPILDIKHLRKSYGPVDILKDINVSIEPGDFLVLVGPSGCGKSTLLNCIAGLEPITGGQLQIAGQDMTHVSPKDRNIAMVFQSYALYPTMTVAKNITFGMKVRGVDQANQQAKLKEVAELLQIDHLLNRKPGQLSGGQRQRVAMGRALVREPALFLFDEPLSNLDAKLRVEMRTEIKKLHQTLNASIVYVTHDQIEAMTLATKIVVMKGGVIQQIGTPAEIYNQPANLFVADFMGSPAMNLIPAKVARDGGSHRIEITRPGEAPLVLSDPRPLDLPGDVIMGLRPEDIAEAGFRAGAQVQQASCMVDMVEPAGADTYVVSSLGGRQVTARLHAETSARAGQPLDLAFDLAKVSYFAPQTGERLN
ncbi:sn-glycerol-3-phosphate ABC transporter ATP-binding protein UgpC [Pseudooceanicola sp. CBS1P-1]|uniref:sn-glycerol-3-phosphate ABC transporter ATP-binding protein UgpC n=1 Tax=Pseudooceanicola albus TaxID=2692189 RepID=A0A6L7GCN4_9RHOB|nr:MULTISPECIES: sn-glycerol-3-phosphate ABC transporter ATP-binding protein UgpC [Pseudooceanicola]MBT9386530.1 sn-glycerol-3-phosphate ABC transporter ATP-binding protein UgpC [Pseudooceanicola endophyticus]MXN20563.1 sn-glycerol-3-phosphate ABC transporter ATP-binding protein UgpC [Pseudooceanicola albus]